MKTTQAYPSLAAMIVAVIFGISFIFTKEALLYLEPFQLLGLRFALAALSLSLLAGARVIQLTIRMKHIPGLLKVAIWQPVLYFICETYGIKLTTASESGVIIALVPVVVPILSVFMLGEKITSLQGLFICAAVFGVIVMALGEPTAGGANSSDHLLGILLLFGAVLSASLFNIFSRSAAESFSPLDITFVMMWLGAVVFNIIGLTQSYLNGNFQLYMDALQHLPVITGLVYLGILSSILAFFLLNYALSHMSASRTAVFLNLIPLVTVLVGVLFYGERLSLWQYAGCALILLGVWGTNYFSLTGKACPEGH